MSYLGSYLGAAGTTTTVVVTPPPAPTPVTVTTVIAGEPAYINHVAVALNRLCAYAREKAL